MKRAHIFLLALALNTALYSCTTPAMEEEAYPIEACCGDGGDIPPPPPPPGGDN